MNRHKAEVRELEADLDAKLKLEAMQRNLDQYIDEVQELLSKAHENDGLTNYKRTNSTQPKELSIDSSFFIRFSCTGGISKSLFSNYSMRKN